MANRWFNQFKGSLEKGIVQLDGYVNLGSDASVVSETILGASVAKTTTGIYTITLEDEFPKLLSCSLTAHSIGTNAAGLMKVVDVLDADGNSVAATLVDVKKIKVATCTSSTGAPADVAVKCGFSVHLVLKNSTV